MVGELVMDAMRRHPGDRPTLQRQRAANGQKVLKRLGDFVTAMGMEPVVAHPDPKTEGDPIQNGGRDHGWPTEEEKGHDGQDVENDECDRRNPVDTLPVHRGRIGDEHVLLRRCEIEWRLLREKPYYLRQ